MKKKKTTTIVQVLTIVNTIHGLSYGFIIHERPSCSVLRGLHKNNRVPISLQKFPKKEARVSESREGDT